MTIEVSAHATETYFFAYAWNVEQKVGTLFPENEDHFATLDEAIDDAVRKGKRRDAEAIRYHNRYSKLALWIYGIRSLWNKKIDVALVKYQLTTHKLQAHANKPNEEKLTIKLLPDVLPLEGQEVPMGTLLWRVDAYLANMEELKVDSARVRFYAEEKTGNCMYYSCGNRCGFTSIQAENKSFDYHGQFYFFDQAEAIAFCKTKLQEKLEKIQKQFDKM